MGPLKFDFPPPTTVSSEFIQKNVWVLSSLPGFKWLQLMYLVLLLLYTNRTSYDAEEKKHWLTVHTGELVGRYM
jgi:hypothetical protein